jgi:hypothetical protein
MIIENNKEIYMKRTSLYKQHVFLFLICICSIFTLLLASGFISNVFAANEIYFVIPTQIHSGDDIDIYLASEKGATGTITNADGSFLKNFTVPANGTTIVTIPGSFRLFNSDSVADKGFVIKPDSPVAAYLMDSNVPSASNDIALLFPVEGLSSSYRVMAAESTLVSDGSQASIVATEDGTTVTFTPSANLTTGEAAGTHITKTLNRLQAVLFTASGSGDLTSSTVNASKPVAVFGGHYCGNVPPSYAYCDHMIEQMPGDTYWGTTYYLVPTFKRGSSPGDVLRVMTNKDGTVVHIKNSTTTNTYNLNAGEYFTLEGPDWLSENSLLTSNNPVLVAQYMVGSTVTLSAIGDPAFSLIPPANLWLNKYIFNVPTGYLQNYVGIAIESTKESSILFDGKPLSTALSPIPGTTLVGGNVPVTDGQHIISANDFFMLTMHGFDNSYASYFGIGGHRLSGGGAPVVLGLTIVTNSLPSQQVGTVYTATIQASGGEVPYSWEISNIGVSPGLSQGIVGDLSIDPVTGVLSWTLPRIPKGEFIDFTVMVTDNSESQAVAVFRYTDPDVPMNAEQGSGGSGGGGGCFIATAAYGSYLDPNVNVLRNFRDKYLLKNRVGTLFVHSYYKYSPPIADYIAKHETLRVATRIALTPLVYGLKYPVLSLFVLMGITFVSGYSLRRRKE